MDKSSNFKKLLLLVNEDDEYLGEEERETCHRGGGLLHRAFLVMVTSGRDKWMKARRSGQKPLWPYFWDVTVASHFVSNEKPAETVKKRILEEIGVECQQVEYLFKFRYHAVYQERGSENEICYIYRAENIDEDRVSLNKNEVGTCQFRSIDRLKKEVGSSGHEFTPWFLKAFERFLIKP